MLLVWIAAALGGCATGPDPRDPLERFNRGVYKFNDVVDKAVLKPTAQGYEAAVPPPVRGGVTNFFDNFRDVTTAVNDLLQGKMGAAVTDVGRVIVNSTIGILGVFDVASRVGLQKHNEDFGQTLGVWGVANGPYLILPLLGPSTVRDAGGLVVDYFTDPQMYIFTHTPENYAAAGVRLVSVRANLLESEKIFDAAATDRYAFLRDAYLQRRRNLIHDGNPPPSAPDNAAPRRKTLKEMEQELELEDKPASGEVK
jgi:phospholipid-binding lipoprotein MlaA